MLKALGSTVGYESEKFKDRGRKEIGMSQKAERTLVWHSGQVGRVRDRQRPDGVWSYRNDEDVWNFSKGKASLSRNIYDLIYVSKGFLQPHC